MLGEYLGARASTTKLLLHLNGNSTDSSGNGNNGTDANVTYSLANGKLGQGVLFNSTSDTVTIANESNFDFERTDSFTISVWAKFTSAGVNRFFITKQPNSNPYNGIAFYMNTSNQIQPQLIHTGGGVNLCEFRTNNSYSDTNGWHNYIWTYDGTSTVAGNKIYYDGESQALTQITSNLTGSILNNIAVIVGNRAEAFNFAGSIDEVIWENRVWTPEYIKKYYTNSLGRF